jgi:citrate lyase subunit gamma (acyl carrier protein)
MIYSAGSENKSDVLVKIESTNNGEILIKLESKVAKIYGEQIEKLTKQTLNEANIKSANILIKEFGALDFIIKARLKTAIRKLKGELK